MPASIAIIELFAKFKNNPKHIDELGMQLIDAKGNVVDHRKLNWKNYSKSYFPFRIRQSTGCDNLIMGPTCSIIYENEPMEANTMLRSPRRLSSTFLSAKQLRTSIVQGLVITAGCLGFGYYLMQHQQNETMVRTAIFITLLFCNIFLTFANRSFQYSIFKTLRYKNNLIPLIAGITILFILSLLYIPFVQQVFHLGTLPFAYLMICIAVALVSTFWIEIRKLNSSQPFSKGEGQKSSPLERI